MQPGGHNDHRLLCNRSIALLRAGTHQLATADAQRACELAPDSSKAWYRLGAAQLGQRRATEALAAFTRGLAIQRGDMQLRAAVRDATRRMTREELAAWLLNALEKAEQQGAIRPPTLEDVSSAEKMEAMFRHVQLWQRDKPEPGDYYDYVALWSESPWSAGAPDASVRSCDPASCAGMALIHRSEMYSRAKCFAQAGVDAVAAIHFFESQQRSVVVAARRNPDSLVATHIFQPGTTSPFRRARIDPLAWSWCAIRMHAQSQHAVSVCTVSQPSAGLRVARPTWRRTGTLLRTGAPLRRATCVRSTWTPHTPSMRSGWRTHPPS